MSALAVSRPRAACDTTEPLINEASFVSRTCEQLQKVGLAKQPRAAGEPERSFCWRPGGAMQCPCVARSARNITSVAMGQIWRAIRCIPGRRGRKVITYSTKCNIKTVSLPQARPTPHQSLIPRTVRFTATNLRGTRTLGARRDSPS